MEQLPPKPAEVEHEGVRYVLDAADVARVTASAKGAVGWLRSKTYLRGRYKYPSAPVDALFALAAASLGASVEQVRAWLGGGAGRPCLSAGSVTHAGRVVTIAFEELEELDSALTSGTSLTTGVYWEAKRRTGAIEPALELAGQVLGQTAADVRGAIEWHEQYMRWHDGDQDYTAL